jgi:2-polyprenyl-6-hydroxyphenyl methylase/3-demethylubiquinone-9 3-methyltransferase
MQRALFEMLRSLPALDRRQARIQARRCKLCGAPAPPFDAVDLNKLCSDTEPYMFGLSGIMVPYMRCTLCGLLFTSFFDDWSAAEFARFIYNDDYIKVDGAYAEVRPQAMSAFVARKAAHARDVRILDYGSGAGGLARHLRDAGFRHVEDYDPFASPQRPTGRFDIITCFEVIEHSPTPLATVEDMRGFLADDGCVLFTTGIQPDDIAVRRASWWYAAPRNGHVSIFTVDALATLAARCGLILHCGIEGMAFSTGSLSAVSRELLATVGQPYLFVPLGAPPEAAPESTEWHAVERPGPHAFRWTRSSAVHWRADLPPIRPCTAKFLIPLHMEVEPGFAAASRLQVGGREWPAPKVDAARLEATGVIDQETDGIVTLRTPEPIRPADHGQGRDARSLGLAIVVAR